MALGRVEAVLLDSFGTLVSMESPGPRLRAVLARLGVDVSERRAAEAFRAEIGYYLEHHVEGRDAQTLDRLRDRCAASLREALGEPAARLRLAQARAAMLESIRFHAQPDAEPALRELRARGLRLVVASNWDCSLSQVLEQAGLAGLVDGVVGSAEVGADKPAPAVFEAALAIAGCTAERALHVGDSPANDVDGAAAAGIRAVLLSRDGDRPDRRERESSSRARPVARIATLAELPALVT
jgi:putative hydrolase of the HAD superfamily